MKDFIDYDPIVSKIVLACYVAPKTGNPVHINRPSHGFAIFLGGEREYRFQNGTTLYARKNDIVYMPKYSSYTVTETQTGGGCYAINFDLSENVTFDPFLFKTKNADLFIGCFQQAESTWRTQKYAFEIACKAQLYTVLYNMKKEYALEYLSPNIRSQLLPAINYIHQEYVNENIPVSLLAELCGISETYFRKLFLRTYGVSPLQYINNLKIKRAKELILSHNYKMYDVAQLSGFHDECYFSREFKKAVGVSPSLFIKNNLSP